MQKYAIDKSNIRFNQTEKYPLVSEIFECYKASALEVEDSYARKHDIAAQFLQNATHCTKDLIVAEVKKFRSTEKFHNDNDVYSFPDAMKPQPGCEDTYSPSQWAFMLEFNNFCGAITNVCRGYYPSEQKIKGAEANYNLPPEALKGDGNVEIKKSTRSYASLFWH